MMTVVLPSVVVILGSLGSLGVVGSSGRTSVMLRMIVSSSSRDSSSSVMDSLVKQVRSSPAGMVTDDGMSLGV